MTLPDRVVMRLLVVSAAAAGCLDAGCVTRLGSVFASVITGNLVRLGRGIATMDGRLAAGAHPRGMAAPFLLGPGAAAFTPRRMEGS